MISVIIRNRNEERWIGYSIQSCINYLEDPEIIVMNNNSSDESISIVKEFSFNNIKIININDYTPGKSINRGVKEASNKNVLVLSAHNTHNEKRYFLHNAFCFYKKSFLLENPFDEKLIGKEERYWVNNMIEKGYNFLYDPTLKSTHHWTPAGATWKGLG